MTEVFIDPPPHHVEYPRGNKKVPTPEAFYLSMNCWRPRSKMRIPKSPAVLVQCVHWKKQPQWMTSELKTAFRPCGDC